MKLALALLLVALLPAAGFAEGPTETKLPATVAGRLIIYEAHGMRCSLYVNEQGYSRGAGAPSCVPWAKAGEFKILSVVKTTEEEED